MQTCCSLQALVSKGIHSAILDAMQKHTSEATMQQWGWRTVRCLCVSNGELKDMLIEYGVLEEITKAMSHFPGDAGLLEEVIGIIACLATDIKLVRHQCATEQVHKKIIAAMVDFSERVSLIEMSLEALGVLDIMCLTPDRQADRQTMEC